MKEHSESGQNEFSYYCKLCSDRFESPELQAEHSNSESHQILSDSVDKQFMLQIGNICEECHILETEETYIFCENDEHFEIFQNIWSNRLSNNIST